MGILCALFGNLTNQLASIGCLLSGLRFELHRRLVTHHHRLEANGFAAAAIAISRFQHDVGRRLRLPRPASAIEAVDFRHGRRCISLQAIEQLQFQGLGCFADAILRHTEGTERQQRAVGIETVIFLEAGQGGVPLAEAPGLRIALPGALAARARAKLGQKATLGIRPEDIHVAGPADAAEHCFEVEVEVVEQLGSEILLDTRVGKALIVASIEPTTRVRAHDKLKLAMKPERMHLFDAATELAV